MRTFREAARGKEFVISTELFLVPESTGDTICEQVRLLREHVDGILVTDNQGGRLHLDPLAAAALVKAHGADPILQLACRNRNRIALLAALLGAAALGVSSLMLVRGNRVPEGLQPRSKGVFEVDAAELIAMAHRMKTDENLPTPPDFYIGSIVTPHEPAPGWIPVQISRKAEAGVQFMLTHICMDMDVLRAYMKHLVAAGTPRQMSLFVTIAIPASAEDARYLCRMRPHNRIPDALIERLESADDPEQEGVDICAELLRELTEVPGVRGAHLLPTRNLAAVNAVVEQAGLVRQATRPGGT
ncbi:MAG: methylenetetrahydrofolate reductase [Woeseiaceae bacterium]|nr:methylenetetrahydrofolate reductase [Woeseiaceae bacterium]